MLACCFAAAAAALDVSIYPACNTAGLHGPVNKTLVGDFRANECAAFVSHKHKAIFLTPEPYPRVMRLVTTAFCEGYQCHPAELTRYHGVRGRTLAEYFVFTFVANPWMRTLRASRRGRGLELNHASCAFGRVDFVGRTEHLAADWQRMLAYKERGDRGKGDHGGFDSLSGLANCTQYPVALEYSVYTWYADDIQAYQFPWPADLGKLFYFDSVRK